MAMQRQRSFDEEPESQEPVTFTLSGLEFNCRPEIAGGAILRLGESIGNDDIDAKQLIGAL